MPDGLDDGPLPRVELRRYLAGVPFSHRRALSDEERKAIQRRIRPLYVAAGVVGLTAAAYFVLWIAFGEPLDTVAQSLVCLILTVAISITGMTWVTVKPFLNALRANEVNVYIGLLPSIKGFDVALDSLLRRPGVKAHLDRYVEILAVGRSELIWRIEGVEGDLAASTGDTASVAVTPDIDESGERRLTAEECEELRLRARDCGTLGGFVASCGVVALYPVLFVRLSHSEGLKLWQVLLMSLSPGVGLTVGLVRGIPAYRFGRELERNRRIGTVRDGLLASGIPWIVNGEPARWRLGSTKGTSPKLSRESVTALDFKRGEE